MHVLNATNGKLYVMHILPSLKHIFLKKAKNRRHRLTGGGPSHGCLPSATFGLASGQGVKLLPEPPLPCRSGCIAAQRPLQGLRERHRLSPCSTPTALLHKSTFFAFWGLSIVWTEWRQEAGTSHKAAKKLERHIE